MEDKGSKLLENISRKYDPRLNEEQKQVQIETESQLVEDLDSEKAKELFNDLSDSSNQSIDASV